MHNMNDSKMAEILCLNSVITERNKEGKFRALTTNDGIANMATKNADK